MCSGWWRVLPGTWTSFDFVSAPLIYSELIVGTLFFRILFYYLRECSFNIVCFFFFFRAFTLFLFSECSFIFCYLCHFLLSLFQYSILCCAFESILPLFWENITLEMKVTPPPIPFSLLQSGNPSLLPLFCLDYVYVCFEIIKLWINCVLLQAGISWRGTFLKQKEVWLM